MATLSSIEPATGAVLWQGEEGDVETAVAGALAAWPAWAAQPISYRMEAMRRFANIVRGKEAAFTDLIARETGRPLWDAKVEVATVIDAVEHVLTAYSARTGQKRMDAALGARQTLRHKPHGVMAVISAYSAPAQLPLSHIIPALIAGDAVVFKPSERTPATGEFLTALLHEAGVPRQALRCVQGGPDSGKTLASHERIAGVLFSGSVQAGVAINRSLALRPDKIVMLEMGGNNPMILWDTPDIASAVALTIQSAFPASGQRCTAGRRLIVKESLSEIVIDELRRMTSRLIVDHPHADPAPYMGPIINMETADGLTESYLYLMSNGGRPITHMHRPKDGLPFVTPGIIDVTAMEERPDLELFGPILQIIRVPDFEAAVAEANTTRFGRTAAMFGGNEKQFEQFWLGCRAGAINWNRPTSLIPLTFPFGGTGLSGNQRPGGAYTADVCAYPVITAEIEQPRSAIGVGLKQLEIIADR